MLIDYKPGSQKPQAAPQPPQQWDPNWWMSPEQKKQGVAELAKQGFSVSTGDPAGNAVRQALPAPVQPAADYGGAIPPMVPYYGKNGMPIGMMPNPAFGQAHGMQWNGSQWERKDPNLDLRRKSMELDVKQREQEMAQEQWRRQMEKQMSEWYFNQQANPNQQLAQPRYQYGAAEPVQPPSMGTPYGMQDRPGSPAMAPMVNGRQAYA